MDAYAGPADLDEILRFTPRVWTLGSRFHVGDVAWHLSPTPQPAPDRPIALWRVDGSLRAWAGLEGGYLSLVVDPHCAFLVPSVFDWARSLHGGDPAVIVLDGETHVIEHLVAQGFQPETEGFWFLAHHRSLADLPPVPPLPSGFVVRPIGGEDDFERRVRVHRDVWAPSSFTMEHYRAIVSRWPYRREFDQVVEAPDGRFVAYVLGWYDEVNRCGEFEPVGTVAEFRRRGLSRAVSLSVLHAFRDAGGETALVYARGDDDYPIPRQVYGSLGFVPHGRTVVYRPA